MISGRFFCLRIASGGLRVRQLEILTSPAHKMTLRVRQLEILASPAHKMTLRASQRRFIARDLHFKRSSAITRDSYFYCSYPQQNK